MAINSGQFDLNADAVLFDRENEVLGFNPSESNVNVSVSFDETLTGEPVSGEVLIHDQNLIHVGNDGGDNGPVEMLSGQVMDGFHMNQGFGVMINGSGKDGFGEGAKIVDSGNDLEAGVEVVDDGGCDGKSGNFSCRLVKNEDNESAIEGSDGALFVYGGAENGKGLVFEVNDGVRNEVECEDARNVTGNGSPAIKVASNNEAHGVDNNLTECEKEISNATLVNLSTVVEDGSKMKAADSLVTKDGLEDSAASEIATYQLQEGLPYMEVNAKTESLHPKDSFSRNHLGLETSYELKQTAFQKDAPVALMQNQTVGITIPGGGVFQNIQKECRGLNLVVDFNSYRNMLEVDMCRQSVSSELNFCVSDLVWGKVTGHPWWPGQIFDPSEASEKAKRHLKKDCYLIAYFGDQTFAWNDVSMIKPFQMHFSQMVKQSNLENFHHAVDCALEEIARRVEFGLSCPCMPEEVFSKLKTQVTYNAGIQKQSSRRNGGDRFINAMSFEPVKLVNFVKSLAQSPLFESDRLNFVTARAQLLAFYRSKGYSQLPEFPVLGGLLENDMEILLMREKEQCGDQIDVQGLKTHLGFSQKRKYSSRGRPSKKLKLLSDLMTEKSLWILNGEHALAKKAGNKLITRSSGRKGKAVCNTSEDYFHNPPNRKLTQLQYVSVHDMWSQLCLAAKDPTRESCTSDMVHFFAEFRNSISLDDSASLGKEMSVEQMHVGETGVMPLEAVAPMTSVMEPCNDSYWTDRIIQTISEEQSLSKNQNQREELLTETSTRSCSLSFKSLSAAESCSLSFKSLPAAESSTSWGFTQQDTDRSLGSEPSKLVEDLDESSAEASSPTALTLKFTDLDSVPSTTDLNKIFGHFGPLIESKTELLTKTNRAKVVFKRRSDAETAFSSAGKYSIFGPALVSYRLKILPRTSTKGTGKRGRKSKKETSSVDGAAR